MSERSARTTACEGTRNRQAKLGPRENRLLRAISMRANTAKEIAGRVPCSVRSLTVCLSRLRSMGVARVYDLWSPAGLGRPVQALTYVSLRTHDRRAMAEFEAGCRADAEITQAVLLAGRCDYALWSWHTDARAAGAWRWRLLEHPNIARADLRFVNVMFGHALQGAPILTRTSEA